MTALPNTKLHRLEILAISMITAMTIACGAASTPPPPTSTPRLPVATPETKPGIEVLAQGKAAFIRIGCVACHKITGLSDQALSAPPLDDAYHLVLDVLKSPEYKKSGAKAKTPRDFIIESIMEPDAFT